MSIVVCVTDELAYLSWVRSPETSSNALRLLSRSEYPRVRFEVSQHPHTAVETLLGLLDDEDHKVQVSAAERLCGLSASELSALKATRAVYNRYVWFLTRGWDGVVKERWVDDDVYIRQMGLLGHADVDPDTIVRSLMVEFYLLPGDGHNP